MSYFVESEIIKEMIFYINYTKKGLGCTSIKRDPVLPLTRMVSFKQVQSWPFSNHHLDESLALEHVCMHLDGHHSVWRCHQIASRELFHLLLFVFYIETLPLVCVHEDHRVFLV